MNNRNLEERDDVAAALIAAEIGAGLKYVDSQTTSRPNRQPPASRLNPKTFINPNAPKVNMPTAQQRPPSIPLQEGQMIAPNNVGDLMIPLPEDIPPEMVKNHASNKPPTPVPTQAATGQLELNIDVSEINIKEPQNAPDWFKRLDNKLNKIQETLDVKLASMQELLKTIKQNTTKKSRKAQNVKR